MSDDSSTRNAGRALPPLRRVNAPDAQASSTAMRTSAGNLVEPIAQRAVRIAIVAEQQALLVGVARVVDDHFGAPAARRAARLGRPARVSGVERVDQIPQLRLPEHDLVGRRHAAELDHHAREALGVGDRVLQLRPIGAAGVGADRSSAKRCSGRGARRGAAGDRAPAATETRRSTAFSWRGLFLNREGRLFESRAAAAAPGGARSPARAARAASTTGATANGCVAGDEIEPLPSAAHRRARRPGRAATVAPRRERDRADRRPAAGAG